LRRDLPGWLWVSPWLIGGGLFILLPMAMSLYYSFTDYSLLEPPIPVGFDNYKQMFADDRLKLSVKNTIWYALAFVPIATILSLVLASVLNSRVRFSKLIQACVFIPTLVPMVASSMIWMWLFNAKYGLINQLLGKLGLPEQSWPNWIAGGLTLGSGENTFTIPMAIPALVIASLWSIGQGVVVYIAAMKEVPTQLYEAARLDGMGPARRFVSVTLPMISPAILFNVIVLIFNGVQVFAQPYILFRNKDGQNDAGLFYTMHLYDHAFVYSRMGYACAMAWVQLVVVMILTGLLWWGSKRLVHYRGGT
jgi:multiple sugar transport system permease protein